MGDHYCCKSCGLEYDRCKCEGPSTTVPQATKLKPRKKTMPKPTPKANPVYVEELQDFDLTLGAIEEVISDLITKHGRAATIYCDAGHNNVEVLVKPAPQFCKLISLPDRALAGRAALTVGKTYAIRSQDDGMVLIETDSGATETEWVPVGRVEFIQES